MKSSVTRPDESSFSLNLKKKDEGHAFFEKAGDKKALRLTDTASGDDIRTPLLIGFRRLFASGQSPTGKIFGGYLQAFSLKSSCIGLFAHTLKNHPIE